MKKLFYYGLIFFVLIGYHGHSQTKLTGAQILRTARTIYDQGRLHELPALLEDASFQSDNEKVEAYKILILTYIYLEEPEKADEKMLQLLNTEHFFTPNPNSDPIEFRNLYNKFRTKPLFRIGAKFGVNQTYGNTIQNHYVPAESKGFGEYSPNIAIHGGLVFEKDLKGKLEKFILNSELMYVSQSFNYANNNIYYSEDASGSFVKATALHKIVHTRLQLNFLVQYKIGTSKFTPYVTLGPSAGYLLSSSFAGTIALESGRQVNGNVDNTTNYKPFNYSIIGGAGGKYKLGSVYLTADIRYQYGLINVVDSKNRYAPTPENAMLRGDFHYVDNDFSLNQAMLSLGIIYPYFKPKKLIK